MFLEVIYFMNDGIMATNAPEHHPVINLKVINIMMSVYMVVTVAIMASIHALNIISLNIIINTWRCTFSKESYIQLYRLMPLKE
jgi:hypothetical protein